MKPSVPCLGVAFGPLQLGRPALSMSQTSRSSRKPAQTLNPIYHDPCFPNHTRLAVGAAVVLHIIVTAKLHIIVLQYYACRADLLTSRVFHDPCHTTDQATLDWQWVTILQYCPCRADLLTSRAGAGCSSSAALQCGLLLGGPQAGSFP